MAENEEDITKSTDYFKYLNLAIGIFPITYLFGFIVINSHLSSYSLFDFVLFDGVFLKAGLLFILFLALLVFIFHISFQNTKDLNVFNLPHAFKFILFSICSLIFIFFLLSIFVKVPKNSFFFHYERTISFIILTIFFWNFLKTNKILTIIQLFLILGYFIFKSYYSTSLTYAWWFSLIVFFLFVFLYEEYAIKKYYNKIVFIILSLLVICSLFGSIIYKEIPANFGGGKMYKIGVSKENIIFSNNQLTIDTLDVLHENSLKYLVRNKKNQIFFVNKSDFGSIFSIKEN
jgi:hypothetical protein